MPSIPFRRVLPVCATALLALALPAAADAIEPMSSITTPTGPVVYLFGESASTLNVAGTTNMSNLEIRCYTAATEFRTLEPNAGEPVVAVSSEAFSVTVPQTQLPAAPCQLRAVPVKSKAPLPPGVETEFKGPIVLASRFDGTTPASPGNFFAVSSTLAGDFTIEDAGNFALESSLYSIAGQRNAQLFYGDGDLNVLVPFFEPRAAAVQVDGATGYLPNAAEEEESNLTKKAGKAVTLAGKPAATVAESFNEATHQLTISEEDPIVKCSPSTAFPATMASCTGFAPTGVTLVRTWETGDEDHIAAMSDRWRSTDGAAHSVSARYLMEQSEESEEASFELPGAGSFAAVSKGETKTVPSGPGAILYKEKAGVSEAGNGETPQGAIVYDQAPSEAIAVTTGSAEKAPWNDLELPYQRTVPAGGTTNTLRMTFLQSFSMNEVRSLATAAITGYFPTVTIGAPANASPIKSPSHTVTVTGTASDAVGLSSLTVNGKAVAVGAGGAWSAAVPLVPGANTITATATDQSGLSKSAAVGVTYLPPATASRVGNASGSGAQASFTVACHGLAGTSCKVHATLTSIEKIRRKRVIGIAAAKTKSGRVTVGSATVLLAAGAQVKVVVPLNSTGRKLLARFHKLPAHLTATLEGEGGLSTLIAQNLTIKPKPKPKPKHHHKR
ncbi:MAG TPA: hypothetical protein VKG82_11280 [Solirubrobacteraceae bacterium]|nr:hypothetical protein [Solirubrobacteraceae bacterium]